MNQWSFVLAAYAVTIVAVALLLLLAWRAMTHAERQAEELRDGR